ncbi:MAG: CHASE2 domain-containing protein [Magnetococcales bacterium]|nr:CHASE2 domain-containing protein [Magnetococcales bacterium]NGZ07330.1 CHASE2 domain-containing protein [Magnetococcales bacterium]
MNRLGKFFIRYDILATLLLFLLMIPAEYSETFALLEEQFISMRQILRMTLAPPEKMQFSKEILLVNTDEKFFDKYGSFPLRRTDLGRIATNLTALGAKVVALDVLMDFPSSYQEDEPTAQALAAAGNVLLVAQADFKERQFVRLNRATPKLAAVTQNGYTNISSPSAIITSLSRLKIYPEIVEKEGGWPYSVKALAMYWGVEPRLANNTLYLGDRLAIPLNQNNELYIDFPPLPEGVRFLHQTGLSALEFLNIDDLDEDERQELAFWVKDKLVLVGDTSEVSHDWFDTPVGMVYGVEIIADIINTLMKGAPLRPASTRVEIAVMLLVMLGVLIAATMQNPIRRTLLAVGVIGSYVLGAVIAHIHLDMVLSMSYPLVAGLLGFLAITIRYYALEMSQKRMIKGAFGQYLSPKVVDILVKDPSKLTLGGEQREMTAFFSDVAGFSTISEKLTPTELVQLLNEYLTAMCDIISRYDGTVDKFEGDAIIAFWGAPLDQPNHAALACCAAVEMGNHMALMRARLVAEGRPKLNVRMGLNSGPMVVGNMGSKQRMDYTIMGDAVNLAARLEGANKFYASDLMVSGVTYEQAKEAVEARPLDVIRVVGKKEPVPIYQLLALKGQLTSEQQQMLVFYLRGLELYRQRAYVEAIVQFEEALRIMPEDGPARTYVERCREYLENPPPEDWDGVFQLTSKG